MYLFIFTIQSVINTRDTFKWWKWSIMSYSISAQSKAFDFDSLSKGP